jgi:hypothetical protein
MGKEDFSMLVDLDHRVCLPLQISYCNGWARSLLRHFSTIQFVVMVSVMLTKILGSVALAGKSCGLLLIFFYPDDFKKINKSIQSIIVCICFFTP